MTAEAPQDAIEIDFDDWLAGGERKAHFVTLYARADLYADIEALEAQRVHVDDVPPEDRGLGEALNPNAELDQQINDLWLQLDRSKREFRVSARTQEEMRLLRDAVETELKDDVKAAMTRARKEARELATDLGVTATVEVNNMMRKRALDAQAALLNEEITLRALADSTTIKQGGEWRPLTREQINLLQQKLGGSQMDLLNRAYARAANEAPVVDLPK